MGRSEEGLLRTLISCSYLILGTASGECKFPNFRSGLQFSYE
jgi:hypothetical protein